MKDVERVNALNKMLLNANVVAYGAMVDLIKRTGRLDLDMSSVGHIDDFPAEIRIFTDNGLICLSITSVYLSGEDNLMVDGYDENNDKVDGMLMRSRRIQWNGCRVHDAASGLWSGSSITGGLRRADAGRGGQWVHYFVALVRESKGDHRGGGDEEMS